MNLLEKLRANEVFSIERGIFALCDNGKWAHKGFHSYALMTHKEANKIACEYAKKRNSCRNYR